MQKPLKRREETVCCFFTPHIENSKTKTPLLTRSLLSLHELRNLTTTKSGQTSLPLESLSPIIVCVCSLGGWINGECFYVWLPQTFGRSVTNTTWLWLKSSLLSPNYSHTVESLTSGYWASWHNNVNMSIHKQLHLIKCMSLCSLSELLTLQFLFEDIKTTYGHSWNYGENNENVK